MPLLLIRADDLLLVQVGWSRMRVDPAGELVVDAGGGELRLGLPPQHVAEQATRIGLGGASPELVLVDSRELWKWRSMLSGPSWLAFAILGPARIPLSVEGLLTAADGGRLLAGTSLELPWRLRLRPVFDAVATHAAAVRRVAGTAPLWRTTVRTPVPLVAVDDGTADTDDPPYRIPLRREHRRDIVRYTTAADNAVPATATRLELTALGGTLRATGRWPAMEWDHDAVLGRDMHVRTLVRGYLYPLGHRAEYEETTTREVDGEPLAGGAAALHLITRLTVVEPVRPAPADARARRAFPFDEVRITTTVYADLSERPDWDAFTPSGGGTVDASWMPRTSTGAVIAFPVSCRVDGREVRIDLPLVFVKDLGLYAADGARLAADLDRRYAPAATLVPISPARLDLVRAASGREDGDAHEVSSLRILGSYLAGDYRPRLAEFEIALPALQTLLGKELRPIAAFTEDFLARGESAVAFLTLTGGDPIDVSFVGQSDRSGGLAAPRYKANAISRTKGPVKISDPAPGTPSALVTSASALFEPDATLLGIPLHALVGAIEAPPAITSLLEPGRPPSVRMHWSTSLRSSGVFSDRDGRARLDLDVAYTGTETSTECTLSEFALNFSLIELSFGRLAYLRRTGLAGGAAAETELAVAGLEVRLCGILELLEGIGSAVSLGGTGPTVQASARGITASYALPLAAIGAGVFVMRNVMLRVAVDVPFTADPAEVTLAFASRDSPFVLTVLAFGGGGYIELVTNHRGVRRLDAALEFGALIAVDFVVARGEAHVLGGVRAVVDAEHGEGAISGYLRIGGTLEILGLVAVSVELRLELTYQTATKALVGRATLIIEIDLIFWEESIELDSGEWRLAGGPPSGQAPRAFLADPDVTSSGLNHWGHYRDAFADDPARPI